MLPEGNGRMMMTLALVGQLGVIMVACVAAGLLGGWYQDSLFGSRPVLTILLLALGVLGGMVAVYRLVMRTVGRERDE